MEFRTDLAATLSALTAIPAPELEQMLEIPPESHMGDWALPCFKLSRTLKKAPPAIAQELCERLCERLPAGFLRVESAGGYLNFFTDPFALATRVLEGIDAAGDAFGARDLGRGRAVCIDYSSINIAKRFHIGHLSTTMIGNALRNLYAYMGYSPVGINHLGDWGTQFGKMIAAYLKWGSEQEIEREGIDALTRYYVRFDSEMESDPSLADEGRLWFKRMEEGDPTALEIFERFKEITLRDAARVYELLNVRFDHYTGESFYIDKMDRVVDELREKGLLEESQGAYIVRLDDEGLPPVIILKADGATLYTTRDLAAALYRKSTYDFAKCLYVVAYQQDLHFKQLFAVLKRMGYDWAADMQHISFGMVSYEGQTLSTRKGRVVYLEEFLARAVEKARDIIEEKSPDLEDKDDVAKQVGIGAVVFSNLYNNRIKDIDFWWDRALNFDGETAPYVQYAHARCSSVLRKAPQALLAGPRDYDALAAPEAQDVLKTLLSFRDVVLEALERNEPSLVTRFSVALAQSFNRFYYEHRILEGSEDEQRAKLTLTAAVRRLLRVSLGLIGIAAPERM